MTNHACRLGLENDVTRPLVELTRFGGHPTLGTTRAGGRFAMPRMRCRCETTTRLLHTSPSQQIGVNFEFGFGSGAGIRTPNLAVNRSLRPIQKWWFKFVTCH